MEEDRQQQERKRSLLDALIGQGIRSGGGPFVQPQQHPAFPSSSSSGAATAAAAAKMAPAHVSTSSAHLPQNIPLPSSLPMSPSNFPPSSASSAISGPNVGSPNVAGPSPDALPPPQFGSGNGNPPPPRQRSSSPRPPPLPVFDQQRRQDQAQTRTPPPPPVQPPSDASHSLLRLLESHAAAGGGGGSAANQTGGAPPLLPGAAASSAHGSSLGRLFGPPPARTEERAQAVQPQPSAAPPENGSDLLSVLLRATSSSSPSPAPTAGKPKPPGAAESDESESGAFAGSSADRPRTAEHRAGNASPSAIDTSATEHIKKALFGTAMRSNISHAQESLQGGLFPSRVRTAGRGGSDALTEDMADAKPGKLDEPAETPGTKKPMFSYVNPFSIIASSSSTKSPLKRTSGRPRSATGGSDLDGRSDTDVGEEPPSRTAQRPAESSKPEGARLPSTDFAISVTSNDKSVRARAEVSRLDLAQKPTEFGFHLGQLISGNKGYISYPRKGGPIRILHKIGSRVKLDGHTQDVIELLFFKSTESTMSAFRKIGVGMLLLSVGADSRICVWELTDTPLEDSVTIPYKSVLQINAEQENAGKPRFVRAAWHPTDVDKFAVSDDIGNVWMVDVVTLLDGEESAVITAEGDLGEIRGFTLVGKHNKRVTSLSWCPDGTVLASGDEEGTTKLWNVDRGDGRATELRKFAGVPGEPVTSLAFVEDQGPAQACRYIITVQDRGRKVCLWDIKVSRPAHSFEIVGDNPNAEDFCVVDYESSTSTLVLCHSLRRSAMLVHLGLPSQFHHHHHQRESNRQQKTADYIFANSSSNREEDAGPARFDHAVEVELQNPLVAVATLAGFAGSASGCDEEAAAADEERTAFELYATDSQAVYILKIPGPLLPPGDPRVLALCPLLETKELPKRKPASMTLAARKNWPPAWMGAPDSDMSAIETAEKEEDMRDEKPLVTEEGSAVVVEKGKGKTVAFVKEFPKMRKNSTFKMHPPSPHPQAAFDAANSAAEETPERSPADEGPVCPAGEKPVKLNKKQRRQQQQQQQQASSPDTDTAESPSSAAPGDRRDSSAGLTSAQFAALMKEFRSMEVNLTGRVGRWVTKEMEKQSEKYERERQAQEKLAVARQEALLKVVSQTLTNNVGQLIQQTIRTEIRAHTGSTSANLDPHLEKTIKAAVQNTLAGSAEAALGTSFQRCLTSPGVMEAVSKDLAAMMQPVMVEGFRSAFLDVLIPGYQRATTVMFEQMHQSFTEGMEELKRTTALSVSGGAELQHRSQVSLERISDQLSSLQAHLTGPAFSRAICAASAEMELNLVRSISGEITRIFLPDGAPEPTHPLQPSSRRTSHAAAGDDPVWREVVRLAHFGEYDQAFIKALSSQDLSVVHRLCHAVPTQTVFMPGKTLLSQPVLLSLLQQLSMDVETDTNSKLGWIQESLMALRPKDHLIAEHVQRLMPDMRTRLEDTYYNLASLEQRPEQTLQALKFILHAMNTMVE